MDWRLINWFSTIGLVLDLLGVVLLLNNGLPSKVIEPPSYLSNTGNDDELGREKHNKKVYLWSKIGLILVLTGFGLQLIGSNIQCIK